MSRRSIALFALLLACPAPGAGDSRAALRESGDLLDEIAAIAGEMPPAGSEGFRLPEQAELDAWRDLSAALFAGDRPLAESLLAAHFPFYELVLFTDTGLGDKEYLLLRETPPVTRGWGSLVFNLQPWRDAVIEGPHAVADATAVEAAEIFRRLAARAYAMNGSHRCANVDTTSCDGTTSACGEAGARYRVSDVAHHEPTCFQAAHVAMASAGPATIFLQVHGLNDERCEDIYLSSGHHETAHPSIYELADLIRETTELSAGATLDGVSECPFNATSNVQGRYSNGSIDPCHLLPGSVSGRFVHIEQMPRVRANPQLYFQLIAALGQWLPLVPTAAPPVSVAGLSLAPAHPNPFNPETRLVYTLAAASRLRLSIHDLQGRELAVLVSGWRESGSHALEWDGRDDRGRALPSGVYLARLRGGGETLTRKLVLAR